MSITYSASAGRFFESASAGQPVDCVNITAARFQQLMEGQANGFRIIADGNGRPQLEALTPTTATARRAAAIVAIKAEASRRIAEISPLWQQINDIRAATLSSEAVARFSTIDQIRTASNLIETDVQQSTASALPTFPIADHPLWPEP